MLSFVIPAYNALATLPRCIDSIYSIGLEQSDFEVIVVDDCSKDNTCELVEKYVQKHSNIHLLRQPQNHRQGAARNRGLRETKGEYVMFVDADDMVENGVPEAIRLIDQLKVDVLFCNYIWMYSDTNIERRSMPLENGFVTSGKEFCEQYFDTITNSCPISYIWRRDFLLQQGVPFMEDRRMEDFDWIERNVYSASAIGYSTNIIYRVMTFENLSSTIHICSPDTSADWAHVGYRRLLFCDEIREESPKFAEKIEYQSRCFVSNVMKIRNLSKFSPIGIVHLKQRVGQDALEYLIKKGKWSRETDFCLKHINFVAFADMIVFPLATIGRMAIRMIRTATSTNKCHCI